MLLYCVLLILTFVFITFALDAQDGDNHDDDDDGGRGQRHHEPRPPVERSVLEVAVLQIQLGGRHDHLLAVRGIADAVLIVRDHAKRVRRRRQQALIRDRKFFQDPVACPRDRLPSTVVYNVGKKCVQTIN